MDEFTRHVHNALVEKDVQIVDLSRDVALLLEALARCEGLTAAQSAYRYLGASRMINTRFHPN